MIPSSLDELYVKKKKKSTWHSILESGDSKFDRYTDDKETRLRRLIVL